MTDPSGLNLIAEAPHADGPVPAWLAERQSAARADFARTGLPPRRSEYWRYTDLAKLVAVDWRPPPANENRPTLTRLPATTGAATDIAGPRVVLFQGRLQAQLCALDGLPDGVQMGGLAEMLARQPDLAAPYCGRLADHAALPLAALNMAQASDGAVIVLAPGTRLAEPLTIVSCGAPLADGSPCVFHPRLLIVAGEGSAATIIEHHVGADQGDTSDGTYFTNVATEMMIGEGARIEHVKVQDEALAASHLAATQIAVDEDASYRAFALQTGAALARHEVRASLARGARFELAGAYLGASEQHLDTTVYIDHTAPGATSRQHIKGVLADRADGVFQGKIVVRPGAEKTDGHQLSRALLLSETARVRTKPELEIYADDVKCGHGATAGALSEDALFYLTARGIDQDTARAILIGSFVDEVLAVIADATARRLCRAKVGAWLRAQTGHEWDGPRAEEVAA